MAQGRESITVYQDVPELLGHIRGATVWGVLKDQQKRGHELLGRGNMPERQRESLEVVGICGTSWACRKGAEAFASQHTRTFHGQCRRMAGEVDRATLRMR